MLSRVLNYQISTQHQTHAADFGSENVEAERMSRKAAVKAILQG